MRSVTRLLFLVALQAVLFAQSKTLVQINSDVETVKQNNLSVYFRDGQNFIVEADRAQLNALNQSRSQVKVLADRSSVKEYYMISQKNCSEPVLTGVTGEILFNNCKTAIVKATAADLVTLCRNGNTILQMLDEPMVIRSEKLINPKTTTKKISPLIQSLTSEVSADSVASYIQKLQNLQTRFCQAPNRRAVAIWIRNKFIELGVTDAVLDSINIPAYSFGVAYAASWQYNVVATITGSEFPNEIIVVGGHHDSIVGYVAGSQGMDPLIYAPGADDNASAVAACFEGARVISKKNYKPKYTVKFVTFAAEEHGLYGSRFYAGRAKVIGENIKLMINNDMIAYNPTTDWHVRIFRYTGAENYAELCKQLTENYTSLNVAYGDYNSQGSDSYSFYYNGYPAVYFFEQTFTPYYHTYRDELSTCNIPYCAEVIKGSVAMMIYNNEAPATVKDLKIIDQGNGYELKAIWNKCKDKDLVGYKVMVGTASGIYQNTFLTTDTSYTITNLKNGTTYYIGILAYDSDQNDGQIVELSGIPRDVPMTPMYISADPAWQKISVKWTANSQPDLHGYNIYRSLDSIKYDKLNQSLLIEAKYDDSNISINAYRYYKVTAVDQDGKESPQSYATLPSKPVTLNKGIMVIDESVDGTGSLIKPNDIQQDAYYSDLLSNCPVVSHFDANALNRISLSELVPYSTVVWHSQTSSASSIFYKHQIDVKKYLDFGGKLLLTADKPGKLIENNSYYPAPASNFGRQYFGFDSIDFKTTARLSGALAIKAGFSTMNVDSAKMLETSGFHYKGSEALHAVDNSEVIYTYNTGYEQNSTFGTYKGKPVGILHNGSNFKTAILSVPLYYIKKMEAKQFVEYVLKEKFGETVGISNESQLVESDRLLQNYPNPFNNSTMITYQIKNAASVILSIYNTKGELVENLLHANQAAGRHSISFDASNLNSGVYFYKLQVENKSQIGKMLFVK